MIIQDRIKSKSILTPKEWDDATQALLKTLTPEEWEVFQEYMNGDVSIPEVLASQEYSEPPAPIEEFLDDPYYLGESTKGLFKPLREDIELIFSSGHYEIALLTGALGIGKSEFASICILRMLYEASCLKDPAVSYGLTSGSKVGFCMLAPSEQVARAATFDKITGKILKSEYFMNVFAPKNRFQDGKAFKGNELNFPKGLSIICGSSSDNAVLGANIMGGFVDELNFFRKDAKSAPVQSPRYGGYSRAGRIFDGLRRRIKSRFASRGKLPGILIGASSKTTKDSLTEQFIRESAANLESTVFVRDYSIVDVKPHAFSGEKFKVLVGNEYYSSKILEDGDESNYGEDAIIVDAPEELRPDFIRDLDMCLRDFLGISTSALHSFISRVEHLQHMQDNDRRHPFFAPAMADPSQWDSRCHYQMKWNELAEQEENGEWRPRINPWARRYCHLDPALTGDAFSICIAHIAGLIPVKKSVDQGDITEYLPMFVVDFILRIKGEPGEEVLFRNVRKLIYEFSNHGFHFAKISVDSFQSRDMIQQLEAQGYRAEMVSVDTSKDPYLTLRRAIYDGRLKSYYYEHLWDELRKLEEGPMKIDHPATADGSKDCADALCGAIFSLAEEATYSEPIIPQKGEYLESSEIQEKSDFPDIPDENNQINSEKGVMETPEIPIANPSVVVYRKKDKAPQLKPGYKKVSEDGKETDLTKQQEQYAHHILSDIMIG